MTDDPRVEPLIQAVLRLMENGYNPNYASLAEFAHMESVMFLARYDALMEQRKDNIPIRGQDHPEADPYAALAEEIHKYPIPMILFCPNCAKQHIDKTEEHKPDCDWSTSYNPAAPCTCGAWTNPPHRSHLCAHCGCIWRPADVPTTGVAVIQTIGENDSPVREKRSGVVDRRLTSVSLPTRRAYDIPGRRVGDLARRNG